MTRDFRRYLLFVSAPAVALAAVAVGFLFREGVRAQENARAERSVRMVARADELREAVAAGGLASGMESASGAVRPTGAISWRPKIGVVAVTGRVDAVLLERFAARSRWMDWTNDGRRSERRGWMTEKVADDDERFVVWARVDAILYALVYDVSPVPLPHAWTLWFAMAVLGLLGAAVSIAGVWQERKRAEKARHDELVKTSFVSNVSHELKTPLAAMRLWTDLLVEGRLPDESERRHALAVIASENGRMARLVENLLDFSRLERNVRKFRAEALSMADCAREAAAFLAGDFAAAHVVCKVEGNAEALADRDAVRQIFVNLFGNAVKYAASGGGVDVVVEVVEGRTRTTVSDRGPGLDAAAATRVFERFWREHDELTARTGGLGLGLAISRALARGMGGDLTYASRPGGGASFVLDLPAKDVA